MVASLIYFLPEHHTIRSNLSSKKGINYTYVIYIDGVHAYSKGFYNRIVNKMLGFFQSQTSTVPLALTSYLLLNSLKK